MTGTQRWAARLLVLGLLGATTACTGPATAEKDTGKKAAEPPPPPAKRSYDNPNVAIDDTELAELDAFCQAAIDCYNSHCDADEQARLFKAVKVKTAWGKALQKHCAGNPLPGVGRRLAKLVNDEGLAHKSRACRDVAARFD